MANFMSNFMPGEWDFMNKTPDIMPTDDATAQLMLKRRLAQADLLKGMEAPQGQMVSGHYVAPSWTQYLANAVNKYQGGQKEREAIKGYSDYQSSKQQKLGELLDDLSKGKEVTTPVDYNEAGNMPGMTETTNQPYSQQEFMSKVGKVMPEMLPKFLESQFAQYTKEDQPLVLSKGAKAFKGGKLYAENPEEPKTEKLFGNVNPSDFTPASLNKFAASGGKDYSLLEPVVKASTESNIGRLMAERDKLPPGDPRRATYDQIIRKETTVPQDFTQQTFKYNQARGLREDFAALPEVKAWNVIQPTLVAARKAAKDTSGGSDLNLIYAMGKIMDPNSVVREGELQMAGDTGSLGQKIMGYYKSVAKGGKLPAKVKEDLLAQIESRAAAQESLYKNTKAKYTDIARRNQINPEDLFVEGITTPSNTVNYGDLK